MNKTFFKFRKNQKGAVIVLVAVLLILFLGIAALAIDVYHLYVVRNELQNAADAGALAGARELYLDDGTAVNPAANSIAYNTAIQNISEKTPVELIFHSNNNEDVQRGHWSFSANGGQGSFTANDKLEAVDIANYSEEELDTYNDFINAVRVKVRRQERPASSFFARIFGFENFGMTAEAVAYIGFSGSLNPADLDQPIAICEESIIDEEGDYNCNMGRMLNSGSNPGTANTGAWTNFSQPCNTADANEMKSLICSDGNPNPLSFGQGIGAVGGVQDVVLGKLVDCWQATEPPANKAPTHLWGMTLPVVECPGNNVSNCATLVGAVNVDIVWIIHKNDPHYSDVPREMEDWTCEDSDGFTCWKSFVDHFNLANVEGLPQSDEDYAEMYQKKNIFFLPTCEKVPPAGISGGPNFGVLAEIPVLVD